MAVEKLRAPPTARDARQCRALGSRAGHAHAAGSALATTLPSSRNVSRKKPPSARAQRENELRRALTGCANLDGATSRAVSLAQPRSGAVAAPSQCGAATALGSGAAASASKGPTQTKPRLRARSPPSARAAQPGGSACSRARAGRESRLVRSRYRVSPRDAQGRRARRGAAAAGWLVGLQRLCAAGHRVRERRRGGHGRVRARPGRLCTLARLPRSLRASPPRRRAVGGARPAPAAAC